jgi:endonuclease YncB( thermonuclease family)
VGGKFVRVEQTDVDRYGRIVGHIYVDDLWVNGQLVKTGNAWVYRRYAKSTELFSYEQEAKQNGVGLWALPEAERMPPWEWRRKK